MKKIICLFSVVFCLFFSLSVIADSNEDWGEKPVITHLHEISKDKIALEWEGSADLYQIFVDGKNVTTSNIKYAELKMESGPHQIIVMPVSYVDRDVDPNLGLDINLGGGGIFAQLGKLDASFNINLASLGIKYEDLLQGTSSDPLKIKFNSSPVVNSTPEIIKIYNDSDNLVYITFTDKFDSDIYKIAIKNGSDVTHVDFEPASEDSADLISKVKSSVTVALDPDYLLEQGCMIPEEDQKYTFSVKLQKWPVDYVNGEKVDSFTLESKESKSYEFTPSAAWKVAPVITSAVQTADGQVLLRWKHDDDGSGCEYKILRYDKVVMVKKGEEEIGSTSEKEFAVTDLLNGKYTFAVVPVLDYVQGYVSESATAEVKNKWEKAPILKIEKGTDKQAALKWNAAEGVDQYHISIYAGSNSLLNKMSLDYKLVDEIDVPFSSGTMEYSYDYSGLDKGTKLKFEIFAVRYTSAGEEQKSETGSMVITVE